MFGVIIGVIAFCYGGWGVRVGFIIFGLGVIGFVGLLDINYHNISYATSIFDNQILNHNKIPNTII